MIPKLWELAKQVPLEIRAQIFEAVRNNITEGETITWTDREIVGLWTYKEAFRRGLYSDELPSTKKAI